MLLAPLLLAVVAQESQEAAVEDAVLDETVITAPHTRQTVTDTEAEHMVISGEELRETGAASLPQQISRATGLWVQQSNLGGGAPVIRGLLGNKILIVVDGVRMNDSTTRTGPNQSLNTIDPYIVDRVEVIRGARSLLYGSDAIGGVVLIWTKRRLPRSRDVDAQPWEGGFDALGNSALGGGRVSANASWASQDHGLLAIASGHSFDDVEGADNETIENTGYDGGDVFGAWEWAVGERKTLRSTARAHRDYDVPRTDAMNAGFGQTQPSHEKWFYSLQDRRAYQVSFDDKLSGAIADEFQANLSFRQYAEEREIQRLGSTLETMERDQTDTVGLDLDWVRELGEAHLLTWGFDGSTDDVDSTAQGLDLETGETVPDSGAFAPGARYSALGAFVQDEVLSLDPWFLTLGLRYSYYDFSFQDRDSLERFEGDFDTLVASAEAARVIAPGYMASATLAQGYRAPNLDDLANDGSFAGGTEFGNPDLEPEESVTGELAFTADRPLWGGTAAVFYTYIDDYIGRTLLDEGDPSETGDEVYLRSNTGTAEIYGVEGSFRVQLFTRESPYSFVSYIAYAYGRQFDPAVDPATGEQPQYDVPFRRIPPLHGRVGVRYDGKRVWNFIRWAEIYTMWAATQTDLHPEDETDPRIDPDGTEAWITLNGEMGGPVVKDVTWTAGVHNALDASYRVHGSGMDAPGAALVLGVSASF